MHVRPEDLLARDAQPFYGEEAHALITGKTVLVTGAGGSIGSELVRQCVRLGAARIVKVDIDEAALFGLALDQFGQALFRQDDDLYMVDVTDEMEISRLIAETRPDIIFHAAAKKHLPLVQAHPGLAIRTNVFGTKSVLEAAVAHGVPRVVNISTDKAADPTSMLGWSKRLAELIGADSSTETTRIASVRFGNVLGSRGSLLETIGYQMMHGRTISLTHKDVTRYFMTIPEASGLVIEAARMVSGHEVFVLDMGEPVRIKDLITKFARLSGYPKPRFTITGLRPGEKLHEVLFDNNLEEYRKTIHPRISAAIVDADIFVADKIDELRKLLKDHASTETLRSALTLY